MSAGDIAGLKELYPVRTEFDGGHLWGSGNYATDITFGDVDGDGIQEVIVTRRAGGNGRYYILANANAVDSRGRPNPFRRLYRGGSSWGNEHYATCCASGDVDGDGRDEIVIGRRAGSNMRFEVIKYTGSGSASQLFPGGTDWGDGDYTTDVAVGVDHFGTPLIGVARRAGDNARFFLFGGAAQNFQLLAKGGSDWGGDNYATGIAFGDVDGDGFLEIGVTRRASQYGRFYIYKAVNGDYGNLQLLHTGGTDWGGSNYATAIAFGDVDGDGQDEVGVARFAGSHGRVFVFDSAGQQFRLRYSGGERWGSSYYATDIAMGDVDGDGRAEVVVARHAGENGRFFLLDDGQENYLSLMQGGRVWGRDYWATAVAVGNARGAGRQRNIAVTRKAGSNGRFTILDYNP